MTGCIYAQVPVDAMKKYMDRGWDQVTGAQGEPLPTYTIVGPDAEVDCILLVAGKQIPGISDTSNVRECLVHDAIFERTGLRNEFVFGTEPDEPEPEPETLASEPEPAKKKTARKPAYKPNGPPPRREG